MRFECLAPAQQPHLNRLARTYQTDFPRLQQYYGYPPTIAGVLEAAAAVRGAQIPRAALVAALRKLNLAFGSDASVARNLERLAAGAVAVVTGQQTGLFTGPAYTVYKALSVLRWAEELTRHGADAVPVFWLASEDHDLAEVDHCDWSGREGLERIELPHGPESDGRRVGDVRLGSGIEPALESALAALEGPGGEAVAAALRASHSAGETYSTAFGKLMARLFAGRGLILLDPMDPAIAALAAPVLHAALRESDTLATELQKRNRELEHAGYHAQVKVVPNTTLLFAVLDGRRVPLRHVEDRFQAGDRTFTLADLENSGSGNGSREVVLSPSALLRPVVQDALLPTAACVVGPAELAYFAQAQVVYRRLLGRMPAVLPRAGFTLVEPHVRRLLRKYRIDVADALRGRQHLRRRLEIESVPRALARQMSTGEKNLQRYLARIRKPLKKLDPTLAGALDTSERKILYQIDKLRARAGRAADRRAELLDRHERVLRESLAPHGGLQSRTVCALPFLARQGLHLLDALYERALAADGASGCCASCHQIVFL
jgi:bacillithiol biosynthesis cysteine-adding enzyme BshC